MWVTGVCLSPEDRVDHLSHKAAALDRCLGDLADRPQHTRLAVHAEPDGTHSRLYQPAADTKQKHGLGQLLVVVLGNLSIPFFLIVTRFLL